MFKSKTVLFNVLMGGIQAANAGLYLIQPILPAADFGLLSLLLAIIHGMGGVYLRTITTQALEDK